MGIKITNQTYYTARAWVTSHDLFAGSQQAWNSLPKNQEVSWSRSASNKVTIEVSGKEYTHQSSGSSTLVIKEDGIYFDDQKETSFTNSADLIEGAHCTSGVNVKNETDLRVRAWVSTHDLISAGQTSWNTIKKGEACTWNWTSNNTVTIEVEGKEYTHQTKGTPGSNLYVKSNGIYFGKKKEHAFAFKHTIIVASSPVFGLDGTDYRAALYKLEKSNTNVTIGIDWPGSATGDAADKPKFDDMEPHKQILKDETKPPLERKKAFDNIRALVKATKWWDRYLGLIFQCTRTALRDNVNVDLVCIQGGPISQVVCSEMAEIKDMAKAEAEKDKIKANINVVKCEDLADFMSSL